MNQLSVAVAVFLLTLLTACSGGGGKKVMVMASGKLTIDDKDQKNIKLEPGTTHNEKEIDLEGGGDKATITVQSPEGNKTFDVAGEGHYVLNLKPDTLVGGLVRYGSGGRTSNLTGEDVDHIIDSTQKLMLGQNTSDAGKTYFILPFSLKKISDNAAAKIVGPYNGIPGSVDVDNGGKSPEMYKLFTNKQKRETLDNLIKERKK